MRADTEPAARAQYLSFSLAGGEYGMPILDVREILQLEGLTAVPGSARSVRGIINLRGAVVPVVDLAVKFGLGETRPTPRTCVLVVEATVAGAPVLAGILADGVSEVVELAPDDVAPVPRLGAGASAGFLLGMGKVEKRFVLLLDAGRVLAHDEEDLAAALREATRAAEQAPAAAGGGGGAAPPTP